jgi:hypothetical protein
VFGNARDVIVRGGGGDDEACFSNAALGQFVDHHDQFVGTKRFACAPAKVEIDQTRNS